MLAPGEEFEDFFGGDLVDVAVDVVLQIAYDAAVGLDGAFRPSLEPEVLFLAVDGWLAGWVVDDEGYASARFFLSMVRRYLICL